MTVVVKGNRKNDGATVEVEIDESEEGKRRKISELIRYSYSSIVTPPPNTSQVRTDTTDISTTTRVWIHRKDYDNRDLNFLLTELLIKGAELYIQDMGDSDSRGFLTLLEDATDEGNYFTLDVECRETSGVPLAGTGILIGIIV